MIFNPMESADKCQLVWLYVLHPREQEGDEDNEKVIQAASEIKKAFQLMVDNAPKLLEAQLKDLLVLKSTPSIFVKRELKGEMHPITHLRDERFQKMMETEPAKMQITKENIAKVRETFHQQYKELFDSNWESCYKEYADKCEVTTIELPVQNGEATIKVFMVKPKGQAKENQACLVFAHGGGACTLDAELCIPECTRYAVDWDCVCFSVDYRKGPEVLAPRNQLDFVEAIEHIHQHADSYGIDSNKICSGGFSAGAWISMGAMI